MGEKKTNKLHTGNKRGIIELYNYKIGLHRCAAARQFSLFSFRSYSIGILLKKNVCIFVVVVRRKRSSRVVVVWCIQASDFLDCTIVATD